MGYDRQRSPFGTRLVLTCYCLFLLVNVLLHSNHSYRIKKDLFNSKYQFEIILLAFISLVIFSISFYGLWFAKIFILCFVALFFFILLLSSLITLILLIINIEIINSNKYLSLKTSFYIIHNYIWLTKSSTHLLSIINIIISCLLNIFALFLICHLCSSIEYHHQYWPYRKTTSTTTQTII
ncbi:unnamed protein product [Rotaria sordida]|uniref:Uncharacterized protein n=1 Tax=Rotaria sordida TaxID=392033 RepID=A0A814NSH6_9BILA|nr:unnamed protein product [Rotaria sordida]CAF1095335.1 unnamed protein product [Rotaria sordida]CAF1256223.1 unnamed protein product [Rotaria sordida]CAF1313173.1 unnamed protein product [Rotaria sordida]CAF1389481.1 unnamed protein product [Rotaria sordida]